LVLLVLIKVSSSPTLITNASKSSPNLVSDACKAVIAASFFWMFEVLESIVVLYFSVSTTLASKALKLVFVVLILWLIASYLLVESVLVS
jgi:hypothetical protein